MAKFKVGDQTVVTDEWAAGEEPIMTILEVTEDTYVYSYIPRNYKTSITDRWEIKDYDRKCKLLTKLDKALR